MKQANSILDFADGALIERVNYEMQKVLENVVNPNTDMKARKLTIEISISPQNDRRTVAISSIVKKSLRPTSSVQTQMVFQSLDGEMQSYEVTGIPDGQRDLFGQTHEQKFLKLKILKEDGKPNGK